VTVARKQKRTANNRKQTMLTLISIETTPNPNSMKLNISEALERTGTYTTASKLAAPPVVQELLAINGIVSIFGAASFLTLNRDPRHDWEKILEAARNVFSGTTATAAATEPDDPQTQLAEQRLAAEKQGQVQVWVQTFRQIPIQVKVSDGIQEERIGLADRFGQTARELQAHLAADYLKERFWADGGIRYGISKDIAREVAEEIEVVWPPERLEAEKQRLLGQAPTALETSDASSGSDMARDTSESLLKALDSLEWQERFQALQQLNASEKTLPLLIKRLADTKPQIRRWTAAKLAGVKTLESVQVLCQAMLTDSDVGVRRTAGDSLSDIGDVAAEPAACQALTDKNKLVRWRAARLLAEFGTQTALPALESAKHDSHYEVRLEVEMAIAHIQGGSKAAMPVWKLMAQQSNEPPTSN
jgi:Virulence factor/Scaffold protein Nfu/NifU N terminal/HEAT repeats